MMADGALCWKCHEPVDGPVCVSCDAIQPLRGEDPFRVLGLRRTFQVEPKALDARWRELSRKVHPDRFSGRSAVERRMSLQWTAAINEARRVLRDPVARAWYLATGAPKAPEEGGIDLDPAFLEQMFDWQVEAQSDPEGVRARARAWHEEIWREVEEAFDRWENGAPLAKDLIVDRLARVKYLNRLMAATPE